MQQFLGYLFAHLWWTVLRIRRDVVFDNLDLAFPDLDKAEKSEIAWQSMKNIGYTLIEYFKFPFLTKTNYKNSIRFEGEQHLKAAYEKGKGVCLLSLHLGNGDLAVAGLALRGHPVELISKEFSIQWLNQIWFDLRSRLGVKFLPPRNSGFSVVKSLKKNNAVIFVLDQFTASPIGIRSKFFGVETGTAFGLSLFAKRTKAVVLPVYIYRETPFKHVICFEPAIEFEEQATHDETLSFMTQKYSDKLEQIIRKFPGQWMWVHNRWKKFY